MLDSPLTFDATELTKRLVNLASQNFKSNGDIEIIKGETFSFNMRNMYKFLYQLFMEYFLNV